jgi:uncharacterized membrane protein (DUF4010 family)
MNSLDATALPLRIIVATLGGMAVGLERQWSGHATGPDARFGGIRTFALLGGMAGIAGTLADSHQSFALVLLGAGAALVVMGYVTASRHDVDATTEAGALVVLAAGALSGIGQTTLASGVIAVTTLFLVEKSQLHALVARIDDDALRAAARFGVMAVVVLPLLPSGPFGPWDAIRPRELWMMVLLCSGLSFAAYLARRMVGDAHGYPIAGLFGGLISSTSVTLAFSRASRRDRTLRRSLALGVVAACTVLFVRVFVATLILRPALAQALVGYLMAPFAVGTLVLLRSLGEGRSSDRPLEPPRNPLDFWPALQMAAMFQIVLFGVELVTRTWGHPGVIVSGAVLGLTDVDALTISMARGSTANIPVEVAARAVAVGILANTALKLGLVLTIGAARFRTVVAPALTAMAASIAGALAIW